MAEASTVVELDERGRAVIPQAVRKKLGVDGERAVVEMTVRHNGED